MARITFSTMQDSTMRYMERNGNNLNKLREQFLNGRTINRPSDGPVGFTNSMKYNNVVNALEQQEINMNDGEIFMTIMESAHRSINTTFGRCRDLAVQGSNDTLKHDDRLFINMEVREMLEEMVGIAQSKHKDNYIFSGKWTNQPPYEIKAGEVSFAAMLKGNWVNPNNDGSNIPATISINPLYNAMDSSSSIFNPNEPVEIPLYDNNNVDPNIEPPGYPEAQRIIPGSLQLIGADLLEKPNKNANLDPAHPDYNKPDYEIDYAAGKLILLSDRAKQAFFNDTGTRKDSDQINVSMNFEYIHRNSLDMSGEIRREIDTGITMKVNVNPDDLFGKGKERDGADSFKEVISLMQGLWYNNQAEINASINNLDTGRIRNLEQETIEGARLNRINLVRERNAQLQLTNLKADQEVSGINVEKTLTDMALAESIYNLSLQSAAKLMQRTLMDYL